MEKVVRTGKSEVLKYFSSIFSHSMQGLCLMLLIWLMRVRVVSK